MSNILPKSSHARKKPPKSENCVTNLQTEPGSPEGRELIDLQIITKSHRSPAIQALRENSGSAVLWNSQLGELFNTTVVGVRQGCLLSPILLNLLLGKIMQETLHDHHASISPLKEDPYANYDLPTTSILWATAMVTFKTSPTDS